MSRKGSRPVCAVRRFVASLMQLGGSWRRVFLGHLVHLDAKARGDKSMPGKWWPSGGVQGGVPRDPRDRAKAGLLEAQSPAVKSAHPSERRLKPMPRRAPAVNREAGATSRARSTAQ